MLIILLPFYCHSTDHSTDHSTPILLPQTSQSKASQPQSLSSESQGDKHVKCVCSQSLSMRRGRYVEFVVRIPVRRPASFRCVSIWWQQLEGGGRTMRGRIVDGLLDVAL